MSIKVKIGESETQKEKTYPRVMCHTATGSIILFSGPCRGTVLYADPDSPWIIGDYSPCFEMKNFSDYTSSITLQND